MGDRVTDRTAFDVAQRDLGPLPPECGHADEGKNLPEVEPSIGCASHTYFDKALPIYQHETDFGSHHDPLTTGSQTAHVPVPGIGAMVGCESPTPTLRR